MSETASETAREGWPSGEAAADGGEQDLVQIGPEDALEPSDVDMDDDGMPTVEAMREALKAVMDPEIGINVVDLGLVYEVGKAEGKASVEMTLTSMGCPLTDLIHQQCTLVLTRLPGVEEADVDFVFSPPWSTEMISDEARAELQAMGFTV